MQVLKDEVHKPKDRMYFWKDENFTAFTIGTTLSKLAVTN